MRDGGGSLEVSGLSLLLDERTILGDITFSASAGDFICIVGRNGAGKSTLFKCIAGIYKNFSGTIDIDGRRSISISERDRARLIAYVPQSSPQNIPYTVREFMEMSRYSWRGVSSPAEDSRAVSEAFDMTDTGSLTDRRMDSLSGGERQKVMIASAIAQETGIILMDEPTSYLDYAHQAETAEVMTRINVERGVTMLAVTHDINMAVRSSRRIVALSGGRVLWGGQPNDILDESLLQSIYGVSFEWYFPGCSCESGYPLLAPTQSKGVLRLV
ncbi:MAG: ABC transporter ATP-binding protein [Synergistaceae bacterium]|jgi:iron complex transport system ATP-binding protein|nr:ABC transporter ATP-binding protein [Synergistaceae bacterium]